MTTNKTKHTQDKERLIDAINRLLEFIDDNLPFHERDPQERMVLDSQIEFARAAINKAEGAK